MPDAKTADVTLDVAQIRSRFIQENLRRALTGQDPVRAWVTASEFRRYFYWVADTLPDQERQMIAAELRKLEQLCASPHESQQPFSTHPDRVWHQLEESAAA